MAKTFNHSLRIVDTFLPTLCQAPIPCSPAPCWDIIAADTITGIEGQERIELTCHSLQCIHDHHQEYQLSLTNIRYALVNNHQYPPPPDIKNIPFFYTTWCLGETNLPKKGLFSTIPNLQQSNKCTNY